MEKQNSPYKMVRKRQAPAAQDSPCNLHSVQIPNYEIAQMFTHNCYITAQLEFLRDDYFTVGDNRTYGGYYNAPLQPGKQYVVWLGVQDTLDGVSARTSCMVPEYLLVILVEKRIEFAVVPH